MACEFRLEPGSGWVFVASEQEKFLLASTKRDNSEVGNINFMKSHEMILRKEK
jgi:ribosomal protein L24E